MVIKIIDAFFSEYQKNKNISTLAQRFDYFTLKQAIKIIIENDHSLTVAKLIWLYYKNIDIMSIEHINEISILLIKRYFFNIFFHWSWDVRNIFYYMILYQIHFKIRHMSFEVDSNKKGIYRKTFHNEDVELANYTESVNLNLISFS